MESGGCFLVGGADLRDYRDYGLCADVGINRQFISTVASSFARKYDLPEREFQCLAVDYLLAVLSVREANKYL